jgi:hypothetical protein
MSVYTSYDMVMDCQAGKPEGWQYLVQRFVPALRAMARHYGGGDETVARLIQGVHRLEGFEPEPERQVLIHLRPLLLQECGWTGGRARTLDLEILVEALEPLTAVERQLAWFETMDYTSQEAAQLLHVSEETAAKAWQKAREALRAKLDHWTVGLLKENGGTLAEEVRAQVPAEPVPVRVHLDLIDGRLTWRDRTDVDHNLTASWYEIDHLCRVREADEALRHAATLTEEETAACLRQLNLPVPKVKANWLKRLVGAR